jgi:hypothetical protein
LDNAESHGKHLHLGFFITQIANHLEKLLGIPGFSSKARWSRIIGVSIILEPPMVSNLIFLKNCSLGPNFWANLCGDGDGQSKLMFSAVDAPKLGPGVHEHRWLLYLTRVPIALIQ